MPTSARAGVEYFHAPVEWKNVMFSPFFLSHSTHCGGSVRLRADVGIGPYICDELRSI